MKKAFLFTAFCLLLLNMNSQNIYIKGESNPAIKIEKINSALMMKDLFESYPDSWIESYISTEIKIVDEGKTLVVAGKTETLTDDQKSALRKADLGSDIVIGIKYKYKNAVNNAIETANMNVSMTVLPDESAEFPGGKTEMSKFIKENFLDKLGNKKEEVSKERVSVSLIVNEKGEITASRLSHPSKDAGINKILLEALDAMPKFKPAKTRGANVKQEFNFSIGGERSGGC